MLYIRAANVALYAYSGTTVEENNCGYSQYKMASRTWDISVNVTQQQHHTFQIKGVSITNYFAIV